VLLPRGTLERIAKLERLFKASPVAYYTVTGPDAIITDVNDAWLRIMGYAQEEVVGRSIFSFIEEAQRENARTRYLARCAGAVPPDKIGEGGEKNGLRVYITRSGQRIYVETVDTDFKTTGSPEVLTGFRDITAQVEAQREFDRMQQTIRLQERLAVMGEALRIVAHAVNNSLTANMGANALATMGLTELSALAFEIKKESDATKRLSCIVRFEIKLRQIAEYLDMNDKSGCAIRDVVSSVLAVSRKGEEGSYTRVVPILLERMGFFRFIPQNKKIKYIPPKIDGMSHDICVAMKPADFIDSILILLQNAKDACVEENGEVQLGIVVLENRLIVWVSDDGCGMPEEKIHELLSSDSITSTKGNLGNAIGVKAVRDRARETGGNIRIQSRVGQGTTIEMELPIIVIAPETAQR
ncbi:MAG: PAS domain S-box protein, partial [Candidatus Margulisiibacteriota bacterium]